MTRLGSILGFVFSLAVIFTAYMGTQDASVAETKAQAVLDEGCVSENVALDEGYGVTRTETHIVCAKDPKDKEKDANH